MVPLRSVAIFAIAFLFGAMVTAFLRWPPMQSSDWAAWVQAVGAIGAIGVAIYVSWAQARNDRARERDRDHAERLRVLEGPTGIMGAVFRYIEQVPTTSSEEADVQRIVANQAWWNGFMRAQTALRAIPLHEIPWWGISECVLEMLLHGDICQNAMNELNHEFAQRHNTTPTVWRKNLSVLQKCIEDGRVTMQKALKEAEDIRVGR